MLGKTDMSLRSKPPRLVPYGYSDPDPRFTRQGLLVAFIVGALLGCGVTLLWTGRDAHQPTIIKSTEGDLASIRKELSACAAAADKARQAYLSERLKLTADLAKALEGCHTPPVRQTAPAVAPPVAPPAAVSLQPPQPPVAPAKSAEVAPSLPVVDGPPHPKRKPIIKPVIQEKPIASDVMQAPVPPAQTAMGAVFSLQVGQERSLKHGGVLRLVAISKLNSGQFCVIAGDDGSAVRLPSGRSKSVRLAGYTYKLTASVKDRMSCAVRVD